MRNPLQEILGQDEADEVLNEALTRFGPGAANEHILLIALARLHKRVDNLEAQLKREKAIY